jgi:hypothetical protein
MSKIIDPDGLAQTTDVVFDTGAKTIEIKITGAVTNADPGSTSGVTLQALYSFAKEEWKTDAGLNKFKFPIKMYTKTDGTFQNGWTFKAAGSRNCIRDGGWTEGSNIYAGIVSLGSFDSSADQAYYQQTQGYDQTTADFDKSGNLNETIDITSKTGYLKCFLRISAGLGTGKIYSEYNLLTEQSISALEPVLYKLPLSNSTDLKISIADTVLDAASAPYNGMKINYLKGSGFTTWANATPYAAGAVVKDNVTGRWKFTTAGGTSSGTSTANDVGATWVAYDGEVQIGTPYYAFNRIITANNATDTQIYNWTQRQLRKTTDINANDSTTVAQRSGLEMNGNVAELLLEYVGDTLKTKGGVYISGFNASSTNSIKFRPIIVDTGGVNADTYLPLVATTEVAFPYVATGNLVFSSNLTTETDANTKYTMYFADAGGNLFDSANAIIVKHNNTVDITGEITASSIGWTFDYDNNVQGSRSSNTDAAVVVVAQGLPGATWVSVEYTITRATGQTITINADDERNYSNPA